MSVVVCVYITCRNMTANKVIQGMHRYVNTFPTNFWNASAWGGSRVGGWVGGWGDKKLVKIIKTLYIPFKIPSIKNL